MKKTSKMTKAIVGAIVALLVVFAVSGTAVAQVELIPVNCSEEGRLASGTGDPTAIEFINNAYEARKIYWVDFSGSRVLFATLDPGAAYRQVTFVTHPWVVTNPSDQCQAIYLPNPTLGRGEISAPAPSELATGPSCDREPTLHSLDDTVPTTIQFINETLRAQNIYWLDFSGSRVLYATLTSGQGFRQSTFVTHPWVIADAGQVCETIFLPAADATRATLPHENWTYGATMPTRRSGLAAVAAQRQIFAMGGFNNLGYQNVVEALDPVTDTWDPSRAVMPTPRTTAGAALGPDGLIYVFGGSDAWGAMTTVEAYNPVADSWARKPPLSQRRWGAGAATGPDGRIYAIGGSDNGPPLQSVEAYDTTTGSWSSAAWLPIALYYMAVANGPDGRMYSIGGFDFANYRDDVFVSDASGSSWTRVASLPTRRALSTAVLLAGKIYVFGGGNELGRVMDVAIYDPATNTWTNAPLKLPQARISPAAAIGADGRVHVLGGALPWPNTYFDSDQLYDPEVPR